MSPTLLLADDSLTIHKVVELVLAPERFDIRAAYDGDEALRLIEMMKPDIILADVEMPKLNGYQLCEKIKGDPATARIPVILLAGAFEPFSEEQARRYGADDFIIKPFEAQELTSKVKALLMEREEDAGYEPEEPGEEQEPLSLATAGEPPVSPEELSMQEDLASFAEAATEPERPGETHLRESTLETRDMRGFEEILAETMERESPEKVVTPFEAEEVRPEQAGEPSVRAVVGERTMQYLEERLLPEVTDAVRDAVSRAMEEIMPSLLENVARDVVQKVLASALEKVDAAIDRIVPEVAETVIRREIEKITSEL